jgi:arylsulfatase A-like enzyme
MPIDVSFHSTFPDGQQVRTIASRLRALGVATGAFGKWHLSSSLIPSDSTFARQGIAFCAGGNVTWTRVAYERVRRDVQNAGFEQSGALYPCNIPAEPYSHNLEWIVHHAESFIKRSLSEGRRFFAYVAWTLPHSPSARRALRRSVAETPLMPGRPRGIWPTERAVTLREQIRQRAQSIEKVVPGYDPISLAWIDSAAAALLSTLAQLAISNATLIIFTSDHGKTDKYSCREHGIRVPLLIRWPQLITSGKTVEEMVSHLDLLPTILSAFGQGHIVARLQRSHDGRDLLPLFANDRSTQQTSEPLHTHLICQTYMDRAIIGAHRK